MPPSRHDDDDDDRPRRRPRKPEPKPAAIHPGLLIGGGAAAVLLLVGLVGLVVYLASSSDPEPVPVAPTAGPAYVTAGSSAPPAPAPTPSQPPQPAAPADSRPEAAADAIRRVKASTVYIRVHSQKGLSSGSGFFAGEPGYVVTNSHVVGFEPGKVDVPQRIEVAVDSGEPTMRKFDGTRRSAWSLWTWRTTWRCCGWTAGARRSRCRGRWRSAGRPALVETQDVFIFGYPLGENLGLNISVNKSTVSSLRKDQTGAIEMVQVAGGMHPGNSGGPVTDKAGAVIGVSVAVILGTSINFAIPAEITDKFVREQIASGGNLKNGRFPTAPRRPRR